MADGVIQALYGRLDDVVASGKFRDELSSARNLTRLDELRLTIQAYELALSHAKSEYDELLLARRCELALTMPVSRLPDEVLATIMEEAFGGMFMTSAGRKCLAIIVGVCRRWYNIAVNIPRFWRGIEFVDSNPAANVRSLERARAYLIRSKMAPIHVRFIGLNKELSTQGFEFIHAIREQLGRIEQLEFHSVNDAQVGQMFPLNSSLPRLRRLDISFGLEDRKFSKDFENWDVDIMSVPIMFPDFSASTIQSLAVRLSAKFGVGLRGIDASNLASVELHGNPDQTDLFRFLGHCSNLETLVLVTYGEREGYDPVPSIRLPRLTSYRASGSAAVWFSRYVFHAPNMKNVEFHVGKLDDEIESFLDVCDGPGLVPWKYLDTFALNTDDDDDRFDATIGEFLLCHPRLTKVCLPIGVNLCDILKLITPPASASFGGPQLRVLQLVDAPDLRDYPFPPMDPITPVIHALLDRLPELQIETTDNSTERKEKFVGLGTLYPGRVIEVQSSGFVAWKSLYYSDHA
ncbi:uncharacterized protein EI90DRAFT_3067331 [Cantharellus anzutake]|uniref:uncharacterized protein n=1 Tax=Cantharellus anzutake TaxID=1750568 RepID=UPI001904610A|nr:uncharacterized protein EI90DRAFT_3067331 [Cantharellus anzutake]KAF8327592.1 hypothetical protein EI90DRAFT_3067331 [Cantharellus anzutake]